MTCSSNMYYYFLCLSNRQRKRSMFALKSCLSWTHPYLNLLNTRDFIIYSPLHCVKLRSVNDSDPTHHVSVLFSFYCTLLAWHTWQPTFQSAVPSPALCSPTSSNNICSPLPCSWVRDHTSATLIISLYFVTKMGNRFIETCNYT